MRRIVFGLMLLETLASRSSGQPFSQPSEGRAHARSLVISKRGIVATSQVLASQAGADMLARGGSAVDAAIAANAVLSVMEPMMSGPGGDLFAIYRDAKTGIVSGLNASGWAPAGLSIEYLTRKGIRQMPRVGIHSVTVPGCVDGWQQLHRKFGRLPWKDLFGPAIYLAGNGFPVPERIAFFWSVGIPASCKDPACRATLLPNGQAPKEGEIFRNPDLANALRILSDEGARAFYQGPIAAAILRTSDRLGGTFAKSDLEQFTSEWVNPIWATYRGWKVYELPPNSRGVAVLEMLNLLGTYSQGKTAAMNAVTLHRRIEAMRLSYADIGYIADPRLHKGPVAGLLAPDYARARAALIDPEHTHCDVKPGQPAMEPGETTYLSVVDREGNIVSLIESLSNGMSGVVVDGMGFLLQNRASYFSLDSSQPNALTPRKRPSHTLIPALMENGDVHIGFGFVGGPAQAMAQMQFISNVADFGMNLQAALEAPRFSFPSGPSAGVAGTGCAISVEKRVPAEVLEELRRKGQVLQTAAEYSGADMGMGQAVLFNSRSKTQYGASDPRADGAAIPEALPW